MTSYTITITPDDDSATTTTLRLDTTGNQTVLTDLHLHAGKGLSSGHIPALDYGLLLRAIAPANPTPLVSSPSPGAPARPSGRRPGRRRAAAPEPVAVRRRGRAAKKAATGGGADSGRPYRRMPDDFTETYAQTQTVSALADHYDVPRHTVNGWIRRIKEQSTPR